MEPLAGLPMYLTTSTDFRAFLAEQFEGLSTVEKGLRFAESALAFVKGQEWAQRFGNLRLNPKKSGELGRDIISDPNSDGACLNCESKYSFDGVEELDGVLSKWQEVENQLRSDTSDQQTLFPTELNEESLPHFALVAGTSLVGVRRRYEGQRRSSRAFYDVLQSCGRIQHL